MWGCAGSSNFSCPNASTVAAAEFGRASSRSERFLVGCKHLRVFFLLCCTMIDRCTIISQIITLLHVSTLLCHPQAACNQCLVKLHQCVKCSCWQYNLKFHMFYAAEISMFKIFKILILFYLISIILYCHVMLGILCYIITCHVMLRYLTLLYYIALYHVMLYHIILHYILKILNIEISTA
jgi:hypothetical protein